MECRQCRSENRDDRRFCAQCGAPMPLRCPTCDFANEPGDAFCGGCGQALAPVPAARARKPLSGEPERRQLTLMFCDLVDSAALSHRLDPEDLREVVRSYQDFTRQVVARYEGFVARYVGDGILVYFGYPHAHEDDAARAIHAGLDIVAALAHARADALHGSPLNVRIGIATGLVVIDDLTDHGAAGQAEALGETPNLAARIQALAEPGGVIVGELTRELAGGAFEYADRGVHSLKGFPQPVRAWQVLGPGKSDSRFDAAQRRRVTPLIGRGDEVAFLLRRWQDARTSHGTLVLVTGAAGLGKSRLAQTLAERIAGEPHLRIRFQCSPYHASSALYPIIRQLERGAGFSGNDTPDEKLDKLEAELARGAAGGSAALFAALLSVPTSARYGPLDLSPQQRKERTLAAVLARSSGLAADVPLLAVFEDIHWIDPTSAELLGMLARQLRSIPVLVLITSRTRPDYAWLGFEHVRSLHLERLEPDAATAMANRLLDGTGFDADVVTELVAKADGVPLFIEELAKTLTASALPHKPGGGPRLEIPATLQDSLMARLDRLGRAKEIAQTAAVIGREFSRELVAGIASMDDRQLDAALEELHRVRYRVWPRGSRRRDVRVSACAGSGRRLCKPAARAAPGAARAHRPPARNQLPRACTRRTGAPRASLHRGRPRDARGPLLGDGGGARARTIGQS